jgi:nitrile hydratase
VRYTLDAPAFHAAWEVRANSLYVFAVRQGIFNMDEYRHAIERTEPRHYLTASYYERSLTALATLRVEKGVFTRAGLEQRAHGQVPLSGPTASGRSNRVNLVHFKVGDRVRVRPDTVPGHMRMPGYICGKVGVVVGESPPYPFPDAHAHAVEAQDEPTYDLRFRTADLWPESSADALVHVTVFQSYLERIEWRHSARGLRDQCMGEDGEVKPSRPANEAGYRRRLGHRVLIRSAPDILATVLRPHLQAANFAALLGNRSG